MKIRPEIMIFAEAMERKLRRNDFKGGWQDEKYGYLLRRAIEEIDELRRVLSRANPSAATVVNECADVANFVMMIADKALAEKRSDNAEEEE
jgi:hypothetical protein